MASTLPSLNYTTPEEFVNYYYEKLKTDLNVYDLQISKVGFVGYLLNLLGYTHFDLKTYYDNLFKEAFVGTSQTEESQYLHAATYGYIPSFASASIATGTIEFDMVNWLPRRQPDVVRREVIVGYDNSTGVYIPTSSLFKIDNFQFLIDSIYKFVEIEDNGSYYYYVDIVTSDGTKSTLPSPSSTISAPLYSTSQYVKKEISFTLKPYNYGSYQTYYFGIDSGYYLSDLEVYVTESGSSSEEEYDVEYTKYLAKSNDTTVFLRKITSTNYVIEFGSGIRGKWISDASIRLIIKSTRGTAGNLIDKTSQKLAIVGDVLAFDYVLASGGQLISLSPNPIVMQQPLVDFDYSESGSDPLSGEDLRDEIINYIQTRDNMISQRDFYNIAESYFDDFKFLFKKFNVFDNIFHLCRSFRDRNQTIIYTTNYTDTVMYLEATTLPTFNISAVAGTTGSGTLPADTYGYIVIAMDDWGRSSPSIEVSDVVGPGEDSITITWDHVPYATKYRVYGRTPAFHDQYWEVAATTPPSVTYSYVDDGTAGILDTEPTTYELQDIFYRPEFTVNSRDFISPFIYKGNTRMNYYDGYLMRDLSRVEFADIVEELSVIGTGFDIPMVYLNLEYDESTFKTNIKLKSYQTISDLVFTISIYGDDLTITNKRMVCYPLSNNYFEYEYADVDSFGIFEGEIQIEVKGGTSDSLVTHNYENFTIGAGTRTLLIKFNDSSVGYTDPFTTVTLTTGTPTAATLVADINSAIHSTVAEVWADDDGNNHIMITPPSGGTVANVFIAATGSTCLAALGLTGDDSTPAILNGPLTTTKFTCTTDKFYQLVDISDQLKLMRYNVANTSYVINIPIMDDDTFDGDPDYYLDKIKNFITSAEFNENRMITDNVQCRFLNTFVTESPFIESIFLQSGQIFSNSDYTWLDPVSQTRDAPPAIVLDGSRYRVSTTPTGGSAFAGHANAIATYNAGGGTWSFYSPTTDDFVLDNDVNIYYRWSGAAWVTIPSIVQPMKMRIDIKVDKGYVQRNNIDIATERENLELAIADYLQKGFTGASVVFYNSLIVEFVHSGRDFIKSVKVYVTDSSATPNEMDNGIEIKADNDILKGLKNKLDIVKYVPSMIYWDVDNLTINVYIE